ncbi:tetratricopeptide repeat-containing glycosyltransferase family 2 protein [Paenibacillus roseipurpureus]|uniref:Glycosyltransferase family 2 protein n=1 Tax=Paenibacillus roseopurpureus TaxID=2918901 RepID=A0AA96LTK3_9BACL|nr:glycosyltransferase family 2 protein [Paenibacillus sp. MBLB1832]WNR46271.1 glycosyltransferase family 2 protein [Paenibacillus sp. MBLB1832]
MITISLCLIVKNEEDTIRACLSSVARAVDEIIIVDTGSTDQTKQVVSAYTDRIYDFKWIDDFSAARNFAFRQATKEYILWLDADDILKEEDCNKLIALKETLDPSVDSVTMFYNYAFDEYGNPISRFKRNRLVKRENYFRWIGAIHEYLEVSGTIFESDITVTHCRIHHKSDRNLKIFQNRLMRGVQFTPRDLYYYANELMDHRKYAKAIQYYNKFLATGKCWVEDAISSCSKLSDCYQYLGNREMELDSVFRSFRYDSPRPEFCCRLGYYFLTRQQYESAVFWYTLATTAPGPAHNWGFANPSFSTWLPHLQLCVCYDHLGDYEAAYRHNELARGYRPQDPSILHNKKYLESVLHLATGDESAPIA